MVHSFAGYVGAAVLERTPEVLGAVVFLDAVLPEPCRSWFEASGPDVERLMTDMAVEGATPWFSHEQLNALYPGRALTDAQVTWVLERVTPQSIATYRQAPTLRALDPGLAEVPATYVRCLRARPPAADVTAESPGWCLLDLAGGHRPMMAHPRETASAIGAAPRWARPRA